MPHVWRGGGRVGNETCITAQRIWSHPEPILANCSRFGARCIWQITNATKYLLTPNNIFRCPNVSCAQLIERIPHSHQLTTSQSNGHTVHTNTHNKHTQDSTEIAAQHREEFRFRCRSCSTEFCAGCKIIPYHAGYTCEGYARSLKIFYYAKCNVY